MWLFDTSNLTRKREVNIKVPPPAPDTGWRQKPFPNLDAAIAIGLDCETYDPNLMSHGPGWARHDGNMVGYSLSALAADGSTGSWYFPFAHRVGAEHNLDPDTCLRFARYALDNAKPKVGANLLYDCGWFREHGVHVNGPLYDIQFAEALIDEEARVSLETLGHKYLGTGKASTELYEWCSQAYGGKPNDRQRANIYRSPPNLVGYYAEGDALQPMQIWEHQKQVLWSEGTFNLFRTECDLIPLLLDMRFAGVNVDLPAAVGLSRELTRDIAEKYRELSWRCGFTVTSLNSSAQMAKVFDHFNVPYLRTEAGNPSFQKEWLKLLEHPLGDFINEVREMEKIKGTFIESYILNMNVNGKLYPQFHPLRGDENGTIVGRFSSSDPNLQNIPGRTILGKRTRKCFTHEPDAIAWRKQDFSQIHYRILAHNAVGPGSDELRAAYINDPKTDYHERVQTNIKVITGRVIERRPIKNINFGLLYGQSEKSLAYKAGFKAEEAKELFTIYHQGAPYVKPTMAMIAQEVQSFGYVTSILGRRIRFRMWEPDVWGNKERALPYDMALRRWGPRIKLAFDYRGVNYKFQGSEPDIMKTGMLRCYQSGVFNVTGVPRVTVHDELGYSQRDDSPLTREAFAYIKHTLETSVPLRVPVYVDEGTGPNWGSIE
jgi:DNA polymerase I-like protein with 3'-5' exonuclease and polymerase domains